MGRKTNSISRQWKWKQRGTRSRDGEKARSAKIKLVEGVLFQGSFKLMGSRRGKWETKNPIHTVGGKLMRRSKNEQNAIREIQLWRETVAVGEP